MGVELNEFDTTTSLLNERERERWNEFFCRWSFNSFIQRSHRILNDFIFILLFLFLFWFFVLFFSSFLVFF